MELNRRTLITPQQFSSKTISFRRNPFGVFIESDQIVRCVKEFHVRGPQGRKTSSIVFQLILRFNHDFFKLNIGRSLPQPCV